MKIVTKTTPLVALMLIGMVLTAVAAASQPAGSDKERQQTITLYGWVPGQSGDITARGREADVDISVSDAWEALADLDGLFIIHYENRGGLQTIFADIFYARILGTADVALGEATYKPSTTIAELGWAVQTDKTVKPDGRATTLEWLAGVRYTNLSIDLTGPLEIINVSGTHDWFDLFIGGRVTGDITERWSYRARADIGGFGIGSSSNFVWNLFLGLGYRLSRQWMTEFGWRWLDYDYHTGSGTNEFGYEVLNSGPFVGISYAF